MSAARLEHKDSITESTSVAKTSVLISTASEDILTPSISEISLPEKASEPSIISTAETNEKEPDPVVNETTPIDDGVPKPELKEAVDEKPPETYVFGPSFDYPRRSLCR